MKRNGTMKNTNLILKTLLVIGIICQAATISAHAQAAASNTPAPNAAPAAMVWIPAGQFAMGTDDQKSMDNERGLHRVQLDGFFMDEHDVTNAEFREFVEATHY